MIIKYNKKRLFFIKILSLCVGVFFLLSLWMFVFYELSLMSFLSFLPTLFLVWGIYYFQTARYDHKKIMAQFGWPRLYYKDITSVKYVAGDILIQTEKRKLGINTAYADKKSLDDFVEFLGQKTGFQLKIHL